MANSLWKWLGAYYLYKLLFRNPDNNDCSKSYSDTLKSRLHYHDDDIYNNDYDDLDQYMNNSYYSGDSGYDDHIDMVDYDELDVYDEFDDFFD